MLEMEIKVPFGNDEDAERALEALKGELSFQKRAKAGIERKGNIILIKISAEDLSALHAMAGSFLRALKVICSV